MYHYTSGNVVFIVITHTKAWFLDGEIHQLVYIVNFKIARLNVFKIDFECTYFAMYIIIIVNKYL